jgi:hypothetical protein
MSVVHALGIVALGLIASAASLQAQAQVRYREFSLGADVRTVSALTGVAASEVKNIHVRPALMQELEWRRGYSEAALTDSAQQIVFSFYNDQLTRLVVDYDRERTAGLTDADMIGAISTTYGPPRVVASAIEVDSGPPVARWGDANYSVVLYRSSYADAFRLIVTATSLDALARAADAQAIRLDDREAPQRELARQRKEVEDTRVSQEQARIANKATFRP